MLWPMSIRRLKYEFYVLIWLPLGTPVPAPHTTILAVSTADSGAQLVHAASPTHPQSTATRHCYWQPGVMLRMGGSTNRAM